MVFDVFGRRVTVVRAGDRWLASHGGDEGKRRPANDLLIPSGLAEDQVGRYLADLCHEWARPAFSEVRCLDECDE